MVDEQRRDAPPTTASTDHVAPDQAFDYWQELISTTFVPLTARPAGSGSFTGRLEHRRLDDLELTVVRASGQEVRRTPRLIARSPGEHVLVSIQVAGEAVVEQDDRQARLRPGAMVFYDSSRPYALHFAGPFEQLVVQVPRARLPGVVLARATGVELGAATPAGVVVDFLRGLARQDAVDHRGAALLAPHALGLLATALAVAAGTGQGAVDPALAQRQRVLAHLTRHAHDPHLSADEVALACHLSRRSLFRLFEGEPDGLASVVRRVRVQRARELLLASPELPLSAVAARSGFAGTSQLTRAVRAVTGLTPAAHRRAAAGG